VSVGCPGTGDISQAVDRARQYVYQEFEACDDGNGIGLARDTFGIATSSPAALAVSWGSAVPGSRGNASVSAVPITVLTR